MKSIVLFKKYKQQSRLIFSKILGLDFMSFYNNSDYESIIYLVKIPNCLINLLYIQFLLDEILNHELSNYFKKESFYTYWNKKKR